VRIWALVPVKPLGEAKTRLACVLDQQERIQLVLQMLDHTLTVLASVRELAGVVVVTPDETIADLADSHGAQVLREAHAQGLNSSLSWAVGQLGDLLLEGVLVLPADLPLLCKESVATLLATATTPGVVVAPDRHRQGTNALLITPPTLIPFCFGLDSFRRHLEAARVAGVQPVVVETPDLAADVDLPEDLSVMAAMR
jgi:2-phospho-L-lactate/phosphoenolpyruvate guanylyltransferase